MILKREVEVEPITLTKRVRMIKLQKMYDYIDVKFKIHSSDPEQEKQNNELIQLEYFLMFLVSKEVIGRHNAYLPNITQILSSASKSFIHLQHEGLTEISQHRNDS